MSEAQDRAFESAVAQAKSQAVGLVRDDRISVDDCRFVLRAIEELESDGVALFSKAADIRPGIARYIEARVGLALANQLALVSTPRPEVRR